MNRNVRNKSILIVTGMLVAGTAALLTGSDAERYATVNPVISQRFTEIPDENTLVDLCYRLQAVQGVTGVSYRDYSPETQSAIVTVFYNPRVTSTRQLRVFIQHTHILWSKPARA
jgi:hypothetical protein